MQMDPEFKEISFNDAEKFSPPFDEFDDLSMDVEKIKRFQNIEMVEVQPNEGMSFGLFFSFLIVVFYMIASVEMGIHDVAISTDCYTQVGNDNPSCVYEKMNGD